MFRTLLASFAILALSFSLSAAADKAKPTTKESNDKNGKEAKITNVDAKKGTVTVKMQHDGKEVEKTFKLAEDAEYMDSTGKVAAVDIFTSGNMVLIFERDGKISKIKKSDKTNAPKNAK